MTTSRASAVTTSRARGASFTLTDDGIVMRDNDKRVASGGSIPKRRLSR
jgi:hypothetical protein